MFDLPVTCLVKYQLRCFADEITASVRTSRLFLMIIAAIIIKIVHSIAGMFNKYHSSRQEHIMTQNSLL